MDRSCERSSRLRRNTQSRWAGDASAAETAIAAGVLRQILLVIILGVIEGLRVLDLGRDRAIALGLERRLVDRARGFGELFLLGRGRVDGRAILRADIIALAHALGRVVAFPESLQEPVVADLLRVIDDEHDLGMAGAAAANLF